MTGADYTGAASWGRRSVDAACLPSCSSLRRGIFMILAHPVALHRSTACWRNTLIPPAAGVFWVWGRRLPVPAGLLGRRWRVSFSRRSVSTGHFLRRGCDDPDGFRQSAYRTAGLKVVLRILDAGPADD